MEAWQYWVGAFSAVVFVLAAIFGRWSDRVDKWLQENVPDWEDLIIRIPLKLFLWPITFLSGLRQKYHLVCETKTTNTLCPWSQVPNQTKRPVHDGSIFCKVYFRVLLFLCSYSLLERLFLCHDAHVAHLAEQPHGKEQVSSSNLLMGSLAYGEL